MHKLEVTEMQRLSVQEYCLSEKHPLVVVSDGVRSAHNVGSLFRTADAFRITGLCLCGITPCPPSNEIHKTALGAEDCVEWRYYATAVEAIGQLHVEGYEVYALELCDQSLVIGSDPMPRGKVALVVGNEVHGVSDEALALCKGAISIPQRGTKHSLNVSCAAAIAISRLAE